MVMFARIRPMSRQLRSSPSRLYAGLHKPPPIPSSAFILQTPRLTILPLASEHRDAFVTYRQQPGMDTYQAWNAARVGTLADELIANRAACVPPDRGRIQLALLSSPQSGPTLSTETEQPGSGEVDQEGPLLGDMSIKTVTPNSTYELGINVNPAIHGQGYASEAVDAVTSWLLARGCRVEIRAHEANAGTHALALRLDFIEEGEEEAEIKGEVVRVRRYAKVA